MKTYETIITFLFNNYVGVRCSQVGKYFVWRVKAARLMFPFFVIWGICHLPEAWKHGYSDWKWWDAVFILLLVIQFLAGFTNIVRDKYFRITNHQINE